MKNFDEIAYKTPYRLFLENFRKFRKISKIFENLTPKTPQISLFIAFLRRNFWPSVLFYGSKKADFVLLGPPPLWVGPPKNISDIYIEREREISYCFALESCGRTDVFAKTDNMSFFKFQKPDF